MNTNSTVFFVDASTADCESLAMLVVASSPSDALDRTIEYWARNDFEVPSGMILDPDIFSYDCQSICGRDQSEVRIWRKDIHHPHATGCIEWNLAGCTQIKPDVQASLRRRGVI